VRIRTIGDEAFLTVKGVTISATRDEYEYPIPEQDALEMLRDLCDKPLLEKDRYILEYKGYTWEVDEFHGMNEGLVVAEIELDSEDEDFKKPTWIGEEVTGDARYFNVNLVKHPYISWK
jgi:CYTH domain-containing protein